LRFVHIPRRCAAEKTERTETAGGTQRGGPESTLVLRRHWWSATRLVLFTLIACWIAIPGWDGFATRAIGDSGDAFFNLYVLEWGAEQFPRGFTDFWAGRIFLGGHLPLAYSDSHLGIAPLFFALRAITGGNGTLAFNLLYLASWIVSCEGTHRLAYRLTAHHGASFVAALGFTYATIRLGQYGHFQLCLGCLIPWVLLLALRCLDTSGPGARVRDGVALGLTWGVMTLTASYYGVLLAVVLVIIVAASFALARGRWPRQIWMALIAAGVAAIAIVGYPATRYLELQEDPAFRRGYDAQFAGQWSDFTVAVPGNTALGDDGPFRNTDPTRTGENFAFPGITMAVAGTIGLVVLVVRGRVTHRRAETWLVVAGGIVSLLLALGRNNTIMGAHLLPPLYDWAADLVPGFEGIRALIRLSVMAQLAVVMLAAVGIAAAFRDQRRAGIAAGVGLCVAVLLESPMLLGSARTPVEAELATGPNRYLAAADDGAVVELPIVTPLDGPAWPYVENPRMLAATIDWQPRVAGYSGFWPKLYNERMLAIRTFPSDEAFDALDSLGVRYVVLRTDPLLSGGAFQDGFAAGPFGVMTSDELERIVGATPADRIASIATVEGGTVIELTRP
jgi:hypothetical protein